MPITGSTTLQTNITKPSAARASSVFNLLNPLSVPFVGLPGTSATMHTDHDLKDGLTHLTAMTFRDH